MPPTFVQIRGEQFDLGTAQRRRRITGLRRIAFFLTF